MASGLSLYIVRGKSGFANARTTKPDANDAIGGALAWGSSSLHLLGGISWSSSDPCTFSATKRYASQFDDQNLEADLLLSSCSIRMVALSRSGYAELS